MKRTIITTVLVILSLVANRSFAGQDHLSPITRNLDPVVVTGSAIGLLNEPISHYGLFAIQNHQLIPIPFQIDERNAQGEFVLTQGKHPSTDNDNGRFDENDELVFMARDTGEKVSDKAVFPDTYKGLVELEVKDPASDEMAWVYLMTFDLPFEGPDTDYVVYNEEEASFATPFYSGQYNCKYPVGAAKYAFEKGLGGNGDDFVDRIKVRIRIKSMGVTLNRSEEDIKVKEIGRIDGPVRVVSCTENTTPLVFGIPVSATKQYLYYYDMFANFAFAASFPMKPASFRATIVDDFKNAIGWTFYNSNNPNGHTIDGIMDDTDAALDRSPWTWSVLTNGQVSFWSVWTAPKGCPIQASLYFKDDKNAHDDQENDPGELPGIGFDFNSGWDKLKADMVEFRLIHFYTKGYEKGMETQIRNVIDTPLQVSANPVVH